MNASLVHPREVLKVPILSNLTAVMVGHDHPSGNTESLREDIEVTIRLKRRVSLWASICSPILSLAMRRIVHFEIEYL
ncbi:hypothetical protein OE059_03225 [Exiguobacterium profundum]|uniref:MPN domain-containing protein n=1 Tax=Exiguobacterium profundum TaxID=307643 RepID=A0ABY8B862_9BACL|nr:JAB domain-containing protein [Exiguobacterium profundum]WED56719.1 hypothetical protein OE059_03225 [Exiguobacterium profundum]